MYAAAAQAAIGTLQTGYGMIQAARTQKKLERLQTPTYAKNAGILDYYNTALRRYNTNPYESAAYKQQTQQIGRNMAQGLSALNERKSAVAGVSRLVQGANDASLNAGLVAENKRDQYFRELGSATGMKAGEDRMAFQQNVMAPYEKKYNLLAMKASGANQIANAGMQNVMGGLQGMSQYATADKMYGEGGETGSATQGTRMFGAQDYRDLSNRGRYAMSGVQIR
jgi:hypothetical protein